MKKIELNMKENTKYEIVKTFVDNKYTNYKALASKLNVSLKTAYNYVDKYNKYGINAFTHKNKGRKPSSTKPVELCKKIIQIYEKFDVDVNIKHFQVILERDYNIKVSYNFLYTLFTKESIISPKAHKETRKKYRIKIKAKLANNQELTKAEEIIVSDHLLDYADAHPRKERAKYPGELIQMDASLHNWFGQSKSQLHIAVDDCTGMIIGAYFDLQETLNGYYHITKQILEKYGIPAQILTDNRTIFNYNKNGKSSEERDTFTQYGFMCHRLGIALYTSSIPQVKGRVERLFQTLQSRLVTELSLKNITTIEEANNYLPQYIEMFNNEFSLQSNYTINAFESLQEGQKIDEYLTVVCHRKVDNGCTIKYNNSYYKIVKNNGDQLTVKPKSNCIVVKTFDNQIMVLFDENPYYLEKLEVHKDTSIFDTTEHKPKQQHVPAWNHPWRRAFYEDYVKYYRSQQQNNYSYKEV